MLISTTCCVCDARRTPLPYLFSFCRKRLLADADARPFYREGDTFTYFPRQHDATEVLAQSTESMTRSPLSYFYKPKMWNKPSLSHSVQLINSLWFRFSARSCLFSIRLLYKSLPWRALTSRRRKHVRGLHAPVVDRTESIRCELFTC